MTSSSWSTLVRRIAAVATLTALPWGWFAVRNLGWLAEPFAVGFPLIAALLIVLLGIAALATRRWSPLLVAGSVLTLAVVVIAGPRSPQETAPPKLGVRIASANAYEANRSPQAAASVLAHSDADVLVVVESPPGFASMLAAKDTARSRSIAGAGIIVRSRYPIRELAMPSSVPASRGVRAIVQGPAGPFVLYAVHALNPAYESTFSRQLDFVERLRRAAEHETDAVVIAGDFNMSDRQLGYRTMTEAFRDAGRASWAGDTFDHGFWRVLLLRIDYVFVDPTWCSADARGVDVPGSDHAAVEATVGPCPAKA